MNPQKPFTNIMDHPTNSDDAVNRILPGHVIQGFVDRIDRQFDGRFSKDPPRN